MVEPIKELKIICKKYNEEDRRKNLFVESRLSIYITKLLLYTPISPNGVTIILWIIGIISAILFTSQNIYLIITGYILYRLHITLDICDGQIARYRNMCSVKGEFLDYIAHHTIYISIVFGIGYSALKINKDIRFVIIIFLCMLFYSLQLSIQDSWYRANFGKSEQHEIEGEEKNNNSKIVNYLILIIASISNFASFLNFYLITSIANHFNSNLFYLKEKGYILYMILFFILSTGRFAFILYKGKIPRRGAYYKKQE